MAFAPHPECPAFNASPRRKSVAAPRAKNKTGSHSETIPTTAKYVKYTFSIMRSPNTSSCAPSGVAICFFRARWPSNASSAIAATVSATAKRFAHVPRPNRLTAANPTARGSSVILFGFQPVSKIPVMILLRSEAEASGTPKSCELKGLFAMTYRTQSKWNRAVAPAVSVRCLPIAALRAGLVSFLSPCVLPLVPGYISMLSGVGMEQLRQGQQPRGGLFASALSFVLGFSAVFISFGASASAVGSFLRENRTTLAPIAGALIILFGLHLLGVLIKLTFKIGIVFGSLLVVLGVVSLVWRDPLFFRLGAVHFFSLSVIGFFGPTLVRWLNRDVHLRSTSKQPGIWSGFLLGFAFAFGWTPCLGPILATVLALAAASATIFRGVLLLAAYSAGLAIPFLLTAVGIGQFLKFYQRFRKHLHAVEVFSGALLLFVGGLIFVNRLTWLAGKLGALNELVLWLEKAVTGGK